MISRFYRIVLSILNSFITLTHFLTEEFCILIEIALQVDNMPTLVQIIVSCRTVYSYYMKQAHCIDGYIRSRPQCVDKFVVSNMTTMMRYVFLSSKMNQWTCIDGFGQERRNCSVLAMELRLSCTIPSTQQDITVLSWKVGCIQFLLFIWTGIGGKRLGAFLH